MDKHPSSIVQYLDFLPAILSMSTFNDQAELGKYHMGRYSWIRDFPDHATFREKGATLACADKLGVFLSLTLCNKVKFDLLHQVKYDGLDKM